MHSSWERPKGQSEGGENSANRPSYCPARPCCTVSPSSSSFYNPNPWGQGEPPFLLLPAADGLPCLPTHCQPQKQEIPLFSSALSPLPKFSIPASNLGDKPEFPTRGKKGNKTKAQLSPEHDWLHFESDQENLRTKVQVEDLRWVIPKNPPRGNPHPQEWQLRTS